MPLGLDQFYPPEAGKYCHSRVGLLSCKALLPFFIMVRIEAQW
jgi:hypothetical protein